MQTVLINFRVKPQERQQLRLELLRQGQTVQEYFARIVARMLANANETTEKSESDAEVPA
jgi:hypothetical protein